MSHTTEPTAKLVARVRRIKGQVFAIEKALDSEQDCSDILQLIAATRRAINGLMNEVVQAYMAPCAFHHTDSR